MILQCRELTENGTILAAYALHNEEEMLALEKEWFTGKFFCPWEQVNRLFFRAFMVTQLFRDFHSFRNAKPFDRIKDYFGPQLGLYFRFLGLWLFIIQRFILVASIF